MKKDDDSSVSIKQIIITAIFLTVVTFGGLNTYKKVSSEDTNTIHTIESADLNTNEFETALVENTEDDVAYSENIKFLAAKIIGESVSTTELQEDNNKEQNDTKYSEKVVSRGNLVREQFVSGETKSDSNKLLNVVLNEIKDLAKAEEILIDAVSSLQKEENKSQDETSINEIAEVILNENVEEKEASEDVSKVEENIGVPTEYVRTIDVKATAYCLCKKCCGKNPSHPAYGITASGLKITPGTGMKVVASDPKVIPLGTNVYIEGLYGASDYGYAIVADTGSAIKNLKIDLYMDTHQMALNWGVKTVRVYILDK